MKQNARATWLQIALLSATIASFLLWVGKLLLPSMLLLGVFLASGADIATFGSLRLMLCVGIGLLCGQLVRRNRWWLPHPIFLGVLLLMTLCLHFYVFYRRTHRLQDVQATIRRSHVSSLEPFTAQAMLPWSEIKTESCGTTITPKGLVVVTSYGTQAIPWQLFRQAQAMGGRPLFAFEVNKRWLSPDLSDEPALDPAHWQKVLEKIRDLGLLQELRKEAKLDRLVLVRKASDPYPTLPNSFSFPAPTSLKYRGLSVTTLIDLHCGNGVTLCREGVVVRDVCGIQSVAWSDIQSVDNQQGAGGLPNVTLVCGKEPRAINLLTSLESNQLNLLPDDAEALMKQLVVILNLKGEERGGHRPGGTLNPPASPIFYPAQLSKHN